MIASEWPTGLVHIFANHHHLREHAIGVGPITRYRRFYIAFVYRLLTIWHIACSLHLVHLFSIIVDRIVEPEVIASYSLHSLLCLTKQVKGRAALLCLGANCAGSRRGGYSDIREGSAADVAS